MTVYPKCPICNAEAQTFYRDNLGEIFGCDECIRRVDWSELAEEQGLYAEDYAVDIAVMQILEARYEREL